MAVAPATSRPPAPAIGWSVAGSIVGAGAAALLAVLATDVWPNRPDMGDRFLVPLASVVLIYQLRNRWRDTPRSESRAGLVALALGSVLFPLAWFALVQRGPRTILLWWLAIALELAALGLLMAAHGRRRTAVVLFPMLFALFALPTPDALQSRLLPGLKSATTAGAAAVLPWIGVPATRIGYALQLPSGMLDVVDACSGALSLTSLLAIAVLTAYVRLVFLKDFTVARGAALVVLTIPIVIVSNTARVIVTGALHEYVGVEAVQGWRHEALGYAVVLVGFALIVGVSKKLACKDARNLIPRTDETQAPSNPATDSSSLAPIFAVALLAPAAAFCLWAQQFQREAFSTDLRDIATTLPDRQGAELFEWKGVDESVRPDVEKVLNCDQILLREYEDHLGFPVQVYVMFWGTSASTAHIHHPDVCWPSRGCTIADSRVRPVKYAADAEPLAVSVRHYDTPDGKRQIVLYWTQNGDNVLPDGRELSDWRSEYRWVADTFRGRQTPGQVAHISVLLGAYASVGQPADHEARLAALCGQIAAELYRVCPWARPPQ